MEFLLRISMRKKMIVLLLILLTILGSMTLTSCSTQQEPVNYFPEGNWDEFE